MLRFDIVDRGELAKVAKDLRRAGGNIRPELTKRLREPTKAIHDKVRALVLAGSMDAKRVPGARRRFPSSVGRGNHVRAPALRGLSWKVTTGVGDPRAEVVWNPSRIDPRVRPLFPHLVGQKRNLAHPLPRTSRRLVAQQMPNAWRPTKQLRPYAERAAAKALRITKERIEGRR